jgi:pyridoxal phosphate enzyme (YggS family)
MQMAEAQIALNIARVRERIAQAASRSGREADSITLLAVTKTIAPERIIEAYAEGLRNFGENYVQEALAKMDVPLMKRQDMRWHFIGHLQRNKVRDVVGRFTLIQSVDSLALAQEIGKRSQQIGSVADLLLEVKLDPAAAKFGIAPAAVLDTADAVRQIAGIRLCGLMGMAPFASDPEAARPSFRQLYLLFRQLPVEAQQTLSMGMTGDFEIAIEEGTTLVRIGTAIFGPRI